MDPSENKLGVQSEFQSDWKTDQSALNQRDRSAGADEAIDEREPSDSFFDEEVRTRKRRRWKQFGLRSLLILLLVSGLVANWINLGYRQHLAVKSIRDLGGEVWYEGQVDSRGQVPQDSRLGSNSKASNAAKSDYFHSVVKVSLNGRFHTPWGSPKTTVNKVEMIETDAWRAIQSMSKLKFLELAATDIDDARRLWGMRQLVSLDLRHTSISDISHLVSMKGLRQLELAGTKVTDLGPLADLVELEVLNIERTAIANIEPLANCTKLKFLNLERTAVTDISALKQTTNLEKLFLKATKVTDLSPLADHPNLSMLVIDQTGVTNLVSIVDLPKLTWLQLKKSKVSAAESKKFIDTNPNCYTVR